MKEEQQRLKKRFYNCLRESKNRSDDLKRTQKREEKRFRNIRRKMLWSEEFELYIASKKKIVKIKYNI